jgi:hypothetical protein
MSGKYRHRNAHATFVTVSKGILATHATEPTLIAMKGFLVQGHPQIANIAMVFPKHSVTLNTQIAKKEKTKTSSGIR